MFLGVYVSFLSAGYLGVRQRQCTQYEAAHRAYRLGVGPYPMERKPARWEEYADRMYEDGFNRDRRQEGPAPPITAPVTTNTVSMPAETMNTIIRAIGNRSAAVPPPRPRVVTRYVRQPPPQINHRNRERFGRGGARGRGRGGWQGNQRGRRSAREEEERIPDPRIRAPINTITPEPTIDTNVNEATIEAVDLAFLNEFANADLNNIIEDDVAMNNDVPPTEENSVA